MDKNDLLPAASSDSTKAPPSDSRWGVRLIFAAVLATLFMQYLFMACIYEEPYPSLMMPGFRGSSSYQAGDIILQRCDVVFVDENSGEHQVSPYKLLEDFPISHRGTIKSYFLKPPSEKRRPPSKLMQKIVDSTGNLLPGFRARHLERSSVEHLASLQDWFRSRAAALFPEENISRVELRWYQSTFHPGDYEHELDRKPLPSWSVPLTETEPSLPDHHAS